MKNKKNSSKKIVVNEFGGNVLLDGRRPCLCEASKHNLINNCLSCGRIICEQEKQGPCFTCGTYVMSKEERDFILSGSKEAKEKLDSLKNSGYAFDYKINSIYNALNNTEQIYSLKDIASTFKDDVNLNKAIEHKDKLLEFDRKSVARSKVYDDQIDYFRMESQKFITEENRQIIKEKIDYIIENKYKKIDKIMLDFENLTATDYSESAIKDINEEHRILNELSELKVEHETKPASYFIDNENQKHLPPAIYVPNMEETDKITKENKILLKINSMENFANKIYDSEMEKIEDKGMCLAVRQPYASLLVAGIKRFEGRTWFSTFKGRLWIYSATRKCSDEEINTVEAFYRQFGHENFPKYYPTGVIVGCVTVDDCLPNEVYQEKYPNCELDTPFVFICDYPIAFDKPLPVMGGGGKQIYKLDRKIHQACKGLLGF